MNSIKESALETFRIEANAVARLAELLHGDFEKAVESILQSKGRVVVCGMGKSGLIGKKIAATLASTGTPSYFMHPTEALHGDLGMLMQEDILLVISKSGETDELLRVIPHARRRCSLLIAIVGHQNSTLARRADLVLDVSVEREACPLRLSPTASTVAALAMGDALVVALINERGLGTEDFARSHPGGNLGQRLLCRVEDVMACDALPVVQPEQGMRSVISTMTKGRLGIAAVLADGAICGIITDGDLRRAMDRHDHVLRLKAREIMTDHPRTISPHTLAAEAQQMMMQHEVTSLLVTPDGRSLQGIVHIHHLNTALGTNDL